MHVICLCTKQNDCKKNRNKQEWRVLSLMLLVPVVLSRNNVWLQSNARLPFLGKRPKISTF